MKTLTNKTSQANPYSKLSKTELLEYITVMEAEINSITKQARDILRNANKGISLLEYQVKDLITHAQN